MIIPIAYTYWLYRAYAQVLPDMEVGCVGDERLLTFYLDGAHTEESILASATWFAEATRQGSEKDCSTVPAPNRLLLFNCMEVRVA